MYKHRQKISVMLVFMMLFAMVPYLPMVDGGKVVASSGHAWTSNFNPHIATGSSHTVGLKSDGTVVAVGRSNEGQLNVGSWTDIVAVTAGSEHTIGLKSDGTVVAVGRSSEDQLNVGSWTDIVAASGAFSHTVGLKSDGTVVAVGSNGSGQLNVDSWTDIVAVAAGNVHTIGLKSDGTVVGVGSSSNDRINVGSWTDIVAVAAGASHTIGLKSDGTVVAVGNNTSGQINVGSWTDIVAVSTRGSHTIGLKSDGTVVGVGSNSSGQLNVGSWTDIVAVAAGGSHTVGLKSDGTVVAVGNNDIGQLNVSGWTGIRTYSKTSIVEFVDPYINEDNYERLKNIENGTVINFGNREWYVFDNTTGYLLMKGGLPTRAWNTFSRNYQTQQLADYLESQFNTIVSNEDHRALVKTVEWDYSNQLGTNGAGGYAIIPRYINQRVGLVSVSEWHNRPAGIDLVGTAHEWTRTPLSTSDTVVHYINRFTGGIVADLTGGRSSNLNSIRPALFINSYTLMENGHVYIYSPVVIASVIVTEGEEILFPEVPEREGYALKGWNTEPDGSGTVFVPTTPVTSDITVYAQWGEPFSQPTGLEVNDITDISANLSWDEVDTATSYRVESLVDGTWQEVQTVVETEIVLTELTRVTEYSYRVIAVNEELEETDPTVITFATEKSTFDGLELSGTRIDENTIEFEWNPALDGANYTIDITGANPDVSITDNKATIEGLTASMAYTVTLTATHTGYEDKIVIKDVTPLEAPTILDINISIEDGHIIITWTPIAGATGYRITINPEYIIADPSVGTFSIPLSDLEPNSEYEVSITTQGVDGTESEPATAGVTTPLGVFDDIELEITTGTTETQISWTDVGATEYEVKIIQGSVVIAETTTGGTSIIRTDLEPSTEYEVELTAKKASYEEKSAIAGFITLDREIPIPIIEGIQVVSSEQVRFRIRTNEPQIKINETVVDREGTITIVDVPIAGTGTQTFEVKALNSNVESEPVIRTIDIDYYSNTLVVNSASIDIVDFESGTRVAFDSVTGVDRYITFINDTLVGDSIHNYVGMSKQTYGEKVIRIHVVKDGIIGAGTTVTRNYTDSASIFENIVIEKTKYGTYLLTWDGTSSAKVELKQGDTITHTTDARFNRATFSALEGIYDLYMNGRLLQTLNTVDILAPEEEPTGTYSNVQIEKTQHGTYLLTWEGTSTGEVQLKLGEEVVINADGRFNRVTFSTIPAGIYEVVISRNQLGTIEIQASSTEETTIEPTDPSVEVSNAAIERTNFGTYLVTWDGASSGEVKILKLDGEKVYSTSGRYNRATFSTLEVGSYDVLVNGINAGSGIVAAIPEEEPETQQPVEPTNIQGTITDNRSILITWEGPASLAVTLEGAATHVKDGRFNRAVFLGLPSGTYNIIVGAIDGGTITMPELEVETETEEEIQVSNVSIERTKHGTYLVTWEGQSSGTLKLTKLDGDKVYSASARFNRATFSTLESGLYMATLDSLELGEVTVEEAPKNTTSDSIEPEHSNIKVKATDFENRYVVSWEGGGSKDSFMIKQDETIIVDLVSTRFKRAIVTIEPGVYELYLNSIKIGYIGTHEEFESEAERIVILTSDYEIVYADSLAEGGEVEFYMGSLIDLVPVIVPDEEGEELVNEGEGEL